MCVCVHVCACVVTSVITHVICFELMMCLLLYPVPQPALLATWMHLWWALLWWPFFHPHADHAPSMIYIGAHATLCLAGLTSPFHHAMQPEQWVLPSLLKITFLLDWLTYFQSYQAAWTIFYSSGACEGARPHTVPALALLGAVPTPDMNSNVQLWQPADTTELIPVLSILMGSV